jgi:hypothetical protein
MMNWGRDKGLNFFTTPCVRYGKATSYEWCEPNYFEGTCSLDYTYKGSCSITRYNYPLDWPYRYFKDPTVGGSNPAMDYCPYITPFELNGDCRNEEMNKKASRHWGENYGFDSRCVEGTYAKHGMSR